MKKILSIILLLAIGFTTYGQKNWYQFGFKIGANLPANRNYSAGDYLQGLGSADFEAFFRAGKWVYGEVGIGYTFLKGTYSRQDANGTLIYENELVETRYLQIPVKLVCYLPLGKTFALLPHAGIIYQPLLHVTDNEINFSKSTIDRNMTLLSAGLDIKIGFIVFGASYRYSCMNFFRNKDGKKPQFVNICAGFQF